MQIIERESKSEIEHLDFKYFGYNSNGVFTILLKDSKTEKDYLINIRGSNLQKLIKFVKKIE